MAAKMFEERKQRLEARCLREMKRKQDAGKSAFALEDVRAKYWRLCEHLGYTHCDKTHRAQILVDHSYAGKEIWRECHSSYCGDTVLCDKCQKRYEKLYPQGWYYHPGDICKHGKYVGGCGADYMCGYCESGEEVFIWQSDTVDLYDKEFQAYLITNGIRTMILDTHDCGIDYVEYMANSNEKLEALKATWFFTTHEEVA